MLSIGQNYACQYQKQCYNKKIRLNNKAPVHLDYTNQEEKSPNHEDDVEKEMNQTSRHQRLRILKQTQKNHDKAKP
jgi:hypothetical protein